MFVAAILLLSIVFSLVIGDKHNLSYKSTRECTRKLEEIVYQPETCALKYFNRISNELRLKSPLLWTPQAKSVFQTFSQQYKVDIFVLDAFGTLFIYPTDPEGREVGHAYAITYMIQRLSTSRGALITVDKAYVYGTIFWNVDGRMYYVVLAAPQKRFVSMC